MPKITVTRNVFDKGRLFKPNTQYEYQEKIEREIGCGCSGTVKELHSFYVIPLDGKLYEIDALYAVETTVDIAPEDQDFSGNRLQNIGETQNISDFTGLVSKPNPDKIWVKVQNVPM